VGANATALYGIDIAGLETAVVEMTAGLIGGVDRPPSA